MTPEQLQQLRDKIASSRQPVERGERYVFCRGWNEALDFVERCFKEELSEGEKAA
jgi:hypothetical protein